MFRSAANELDKWLKRSNRKPMVLKGVRQVGQTWLVRDLAKRLKIELLGINFERFPNLADVFLENCLEDVLNDRQANFDTTFRPD